METLLLNECWFFMVIMVIIIVATATFIELLCMLRPTGPELHLLHSVLMTTP